MSTASQPPAPRPSSRESADGVAPVESIDRSRPQTGEDHDGGAGVDAHGSDGVGAVEAAAQPPAVGSVPTPRKVRRAPNFAAFMLTGAVLGFVVGMIVDRFGLPFVGGAPEFGEQMTASSYSAATSLGFLGVLGALFGVLVATVVALVLDRRS